MSFLVLPDTVPHLEEDGSNLSTFAVHFREAMQAMHCWGHIDGTNTCPVPKDTTCPTNVESKAIKQWECKDAITGYLLSIRLPDVITLYIDDRQTVKEQWNQFIEELCQLGHKDIPNMYAPKGVTHPEPDSMWEEIEMNAPAHLEGMGPDTLMEEEDDCLLKVEEDGATRKAASVEGDVDPRIELQGPGVSCLATQENAESLTLPSPTSPTTPEAASMQRSLAVNTEMPAIPVPDHSVDLELQVHNAPLPPNKAAEHPIHQAPEQIQAPTKVGGPLESLPGEALQCAMGQMVLTSAHAHEGKMPIREAHSRPPDIPNPQRQGSTAWEPASQLEGEKNIHLRCVGSELHAAPSTPQNSSSSFSPSPFLPLNTLTHKNSLHGEGAATKWHTIEDCPHPKPSKLPDTHGQGLQEAGGVPSVLGNSPAFLENPDPFGLPGADKNANVKEVEPLRIDAYK